MNTYVGIKKVWIIKDRKNKDAEAMIGVTCDDRDI